MLEKVKEIVAEELGGHQIFEIQKFISGAEIPDKIISAAAGDTGSFHIGIAQGSGDHFVQSSVTAAGIKTNRPACFCIFFCNFPGVAGIFRGNNLAGQGQLCSCFLNGRGQKRHRIGGSGYGIDNKNMFHLIISPL